MTRLDTLKQRALQLFQPDGWLMKLWPLWSLFLLSLVATLLANPVKAGLMIYGLSKVLMGGLLGMVVHWGWRQISPMPAEPTGIEVGTDWKCAAGIICAAIVALAFVP